LENRKRWLTDTCNACVKILYKDAFYYISTPDHDIEEYISEKLGSTDFKILAVRKGY